MSTDDFNELALPNGFSEIPPNWPTLTLRELMGLAAHFHLLRSTTADFSLLIHWIRERAQQELDTGDGIKVETVRVERKLDGTVSVSFGL